MDGPELDAFRHTYRAWLAEHVPPDWRAAEADDPVAVSRAWMRELDGGGYAAPGWPVEHGGMAASLAQQIVMFEENAAADAPPTGLFGIGLNHAGSTLIVHGTDEQREHLARIRRGDEIWCQGFSEPDAGSDLAALQTRAARDGDAYVVNGQKVWSSMAARADWCLLLVRTDPSAPKRKGISYLLLDLRTPGITVRPLRQITGSAEFCEIFLDDVVIPVANRVGPENEGWRISQTTLSTERGPFFLASVHALRDRVRDGVELLRSTPGPDGRPLANDASVRQSFARDAGEVEILAELYSQVLDSQMRAGHAGPEASIIKLYYSEVLHRLTGHLVDAVGLAAEVDGATLVDHLGSWGMMIGGGTNEIQRNVIGERVLGLPREPR
ncbi:MAG TPA: acyl-CoA dehydrogenase family protein [Acidimicrobiales bacterium]|nr:acyl-CoA dehydrogenase family protein [Acidimicrobiales bacterium]